MKQMILALTCAALNLAIPSHTLAQGGAVLVDWEGPFWYSNVTPDCYVQFTMTLVNNSGLNVTSSTNGFVLYVQPNPGPVNSPIDGALLDLSAGMIGDSLPIFWDGGTFVNEFSFNDGLGADTVGFGGFRLFSTGIPDGASLKSYYIRVKIPEAVAGNYLCLDSAFYPPGNPWLWTTEDGGNVFPDWGGPYCFLIETCPCGWFEFTDTSSVVDAPVCGDTAIYDFYARNITNPAHLPNFMILEGPGQIERIDDSTGRWTYVPTPAQIGSSVHVDIQVYGDGECEYRSVDINLVDGTVEIVSGCGGLIETTVGQTVAHNLSATCGDFISAVAANFTMYGTASITPDGDFAFTGDQYDRGLCSFEVSASDGTDTSTCSFSILITDPTCYLRGNVDGHMNGDIGSRDVSDLTYLVDYLFRAGYPPANLEEADVNADGTMNVSDLTALVDYLFRGGPPPPPCS